jgi:isopenicillin N synthase-like dioxygenase
VNTWPSKPAGYREACSLYCREIRALSLRLLEAISESLGLEADFLDKALGKHEQHMAVNYYPKCPNPELTFGSPAHSDPNVLTLLLQDEVPGLQVLNNGHWIAINPIPNSFVINIGDQLQECVQILSNGSNGRYRSVLHRAVVSSSKSRIYSPSPDAVIAPAPASIVDEHPALFRRFTYDEYYQNFLNKKLQGNTCLQSFSHDS